MLPDLNLISLFAIAFGTSTIAGIFGFGGGMLLVAALPNFVPAAAIIPLHSSTQLVSNASRAALGWRFIQWSFVRPYLLGSLIGITLAYTALKGINLSVLPAIIGVYILLNTWSKPFTRLLSRFNSFYVIGAVQTGISLLVGAPGPLALPALMQRLNNHHSIVCTIAIFMSISHVLKLAIFAALDFNYGRYLLDIIVLAFAAYGGSIAGTRLRHKLQPENYVWVVKWLLTALSLLAIYRAICAT